MTTLLATTGTYFAHPHTAEDDMQLYFVRHATASSKTKWTADDDLRPLTRAGRQRFTASCEALIGASALRPDLIVTSPILRASQSAELLYEILPGAAKVVTDERLGHGFDLAGLAAIIAEHRDTANLAIVGHNPSFEAVLSAVIGTADIDMRKGAIALVDIGDPAEPSGRLLWLAPPTLFARHNGS
jgi:phosphohistidine phosphatase